MAGAGTGSRPCAVRTRPPPTFMGDATTLLAEWAGVEASVQESAHVDLQREIAELTQSAKVSRGSQQTLYFLGPEGTVTPVPVTVGATDGTLTSVRGPGVEAGRKVVTSELAPPT